MKNRTKKTKKSQSSALLKIGFMIIIILSLSGALYFFINPAKQQPAIVYTEPIPPLPEETKELFDEAIIDLPEPTTLTAKPHLPKIAIIIDDIGHRKKIAIDLIELELELSFSVLPQSPHAEYLARKISAKGRDLLLHLPLEPTDSKWDPGPGALKLSMTAGTRRNILEQNLAVSDFIGINNHMGSKYTANSQAMHTLLFQIKEKDLFFVDSLTTGKSVAYSTAQKLGVKTAKRDIFLDNEQTTQAIKKQLNKLIVVALKKGSAIGIGHPYPTTLKALQSFQSTHDKRVSLVGIHELVQ